MPFGGAELLTDEDMAHFFNRPVPPASEAPITISQGMYRDKDNRLALFPTFWRHGNILDYILGAEISASLRSLPLAERMQTIPAKLRPALPQSQFDSDYPPTILIHGSLDSIVELAESQTTYNRLRELGVKVELLVVDGASHGLVDPKNPPSFVPGAAETNEKGLDFVVQELF
ncbi:hypothetical protein MMC28_008309 [Mycoblastus sanguinarius]|nr:hypothetical protein [Mycoblastus sanguinarius]